MKKNREWIELVVIALVALASAMPAQAGPREQALRIYNRVAGVPPSDAELATMVTAIAAGDYSTAAKIATASYAFYNTNLVHWAHPLSNREETPRPENGESTLVPLNDYVATIVGMVRDNVPFDQVLYGDIIYTGAASLANVAAFSFSSNTHYQNIGDQISPMGGLDLSNPATLVKQTQTALRPTITDVAGVLTTRDSGLNFFSAGTNRRPFRYALKEFLCTDPAGVSDTTVPDFRVRRDVDRAPTGNSQVYLTFCKGCHAGMDGMAGAFAFFDFDGNALTYTPNSVTSKLTKVNNYPYGYVTTDDTWVNLWVNGQNSKLGWKASAGSGKGAHALGQALARTQQFATCMASRAFQLGCMHWPTASDASDIANLSGAFISGGYNMKSLFESAAILPQCRGN